jgi:hypothetical protein
MAIYSLRLSSVGKTTQAQPFTAAAHLKYITRKQAVTHVLAGRMPGQRRSAIAWLKREERADRKNARVIDKLVLALPRELAPTEQHALVDAFAEKLTRGRASWFAAFHTAGKDQHNPHCHLILRDRDFETGKRVMFLSAGRKEAAQRSGKGQSAPTTLNDIRELWERCANAALASAGRAEQIDRRSLKARGEKRRAQVHEGPNIRGMHKRGFRPQSKARVMRNSPYRRRGRSQTRIVRYPEIDKGLTRVEYNAALKAAPRASEARQAAAAAAGRGQASSGRSTAGGTRAEVTLRPPEQSPPLPRRSEPPPMQPASPPSAHSKPLDLRTFAIVPVPAAGYASHMADDIDELVRKVEAAEISFADAYARLIRVTGGLYADGVEAAGQLYAIAEEFGADRAAMAMLGNVEQFGELAEQARDDVIADAADGLEQALEATLVAQERVDEAVAARERDLRTLMAGRLQHININGREFVLDVRHGELRSADNPDERYQLADPPAPERAAGEPTLSLTEQAAQEQNVPEAQPNRSDPRTRSR